MNRGSFVLRRGARSMGVAALVVASLGAGGAFPATAAEEVECVPTQGFTDCRIFDFTGTKEEFQVPAGIEELDVRAWGEAGSGTPQASGGAGIYVAGALEVKPGERLTVKVGGDYSAPRFGDAIGGKSFDSYSWGGSSTGIRTADGAPLLIAAGGGGGGAWGVSLSGRGGAAGAENGHDASEAGLGGKGATGVKGGAGAGEGAPGADAKDGGAGGDGGSKGGGGGGAGYAGGGGGAAKNDKGDTGSGGGGSSYVDRERISDVRLVEGDRYHPPMEDDPFWVPAPHNTPEAGVAEGGNNGPGGDGRVVFQWNDTTKPVLADLAGESGDGQTVAPDRQFDPMVVVARAKDGRPVPGVKVTFTIDDPDKLVWFDWDESDTTHEAVVKTDAQGRAASPHITTGKAEGDFTVRAAARGVDGVEFTGHVKKLTTEVAAVAGDGQQAEQGEAFGERLRAEVTDSGKTAADKTVEFVVESDDEDAPVFKGGERTASATTDASGQVAAPELIAGEGVGTYTVVAKSGEASARFKVEVTEKGASPSPTPSSSASASQTPGGSAGGTDPQGGSGGGLALTGTAGIGTLALAAALLAGLGIATVRFGPRLRARVRD